MIVVKRGERAYSKLLQFGAENNNFIDLLYASLLALCPLLQYYIGIFEDAGITILIVVVPWLLFRLLYKTCRGNKMPIAKFSVIFGLLVFFAYKAVIHDLNIKNIAFNVALILLYLSAACGCLNIKQFILAASKVATVACILVIIQTISYYLLNYHIQLAPTSLFTEDAWAWVLLAKTGLIGVTQQMGSLYRPSAFFMEPSHMFLYVFPHLCFMVLSPNMNRVKLRRGVLYSIGLILTTSGMGLIVVAGVWGLYFTMSSGVQNKLRLQNILKPKNILLVMFFVVLGVGAFVSVPVIREGVMRFLDTSDAGAIAGRTRLANMLLESLGSKNIIFGVESTTAGLDFNMPGFVATIYKFGIIGTVFSYWIYLYGVFKLKGHFFWISLIVVVTSFFSAQTHGAFYMMYYAFIILEGWNVRYEIKRNTTKMRYYI